MKRHATLPVMLALAVAVLLSAPVHAGYTGHYYEASNGYNSGGTPPGLPYWIYIPDGYDPAQSGPLPLFIYLHSSGNSGTDNQGPAQHPNASALRAVVSNPETPGFLIVPQTAYSGFDWGDSSVVALWELIEDELIGNQGLWIDLDRVYVTGWSLGAVGIFSWASEAPDRITAGCPFAGSMFWNQDSVEKATNRGTVAMWAFSGANDGTVPPSGTYADMQAQAYYGGDPLMTTYAAAGHSECVARVRELEHAIYWWMLAQRNGEPNDMSMFVGWETNTTETRTMDGAAQSETRSDPMFVGYYGNGTLEILNGAVMECRNGYMATHKYGRGSLIVDGDGSRFDSAHEIWVGKEGIGALHVANGGIVEGTWIDVSMISYLSGNGTLIGNVRMHGKCYPGDVPQTLTSQPPVAGIIGGRRPTPEPLTALAADEPVSGAGTSGSPTGLLSVAGDWFMYPSSIMNVELGGTGTGEFDAVEAAGQAALGGKLNVSLVDGYQPSVGDVFPIVTAQSVTGAFASTTGLNVGGGVILQLQQTASAVNLVAVAGLPGDADGNGSVSLGDFSILKNNFGMTEGATWSDGDFDGDGDVDLDDFILLKKHFGQQL
ncbi:MAG: dockerin type I domain-containing protein [Planctomycetota bacterium]